jgi:hypothetical protein
VRLQSGSLAIFSPVALTPTVQSKLKSLSPNPAHTYLIAPDMEHHIFLSAWYSHFPSSHVIAPEGLAEKRATQNKTDKTVTIIPFSTIFTAQNKSEIKISEEFDKEFEYEYLPSHLLSTSPPRSNIPRQASIPPQDGRRGFLPR